MGLITDKPNKEEEEEEKEEEEEESQKMVSKCNEEGKKIHFRSYGKRIIIIIIIFEEMELMWMLEQKGIKTRHLVNGH